MATASGYQDEVRLAGDKTDHVLRLADKLNEMRIRRKGCDLIIKVGGNEIAVHRNVMMAGSDFFDAMFTHDMLEKQSRVVDMTDISFRIFSKCVEFIYTGDLFLIMEDCEELLYAAGKLQLTTVCDSISLFLQTHLEPSTFIATKRIADKFFLAKLKKVCDDFALRNLDEIVKETEFDSLEKEYISFLIATKKSTDFEGEDSKMAVILQWIKADFAKRSEHLIDLVNLLDFGKISDGILKHIVMKEKICYELLKLEKPFPASIYDSSVEAKSPRVTFGPPEQSLVVFDVMNKALRAYTPSSRNWTQMQAFHEDMDTEGWAIAAAVVDNFIYAFFKNKGFRLSKKVEGASWERLPDMIKTLLTPVAAVCGKDVYVVGEDSMARYCVTKNEWAEINCNGISNCKRCGLAVHGNLVYTVGGYGEDLLAAVDVNEYSPMTSFWSSREPLPSSRVNPDAVVYDDKIYVAGGYRGRLWLDDFMSFDPRANTWTQLPSMTVAKGFCGLCVASNQLYAVGDSSDACSIETYDFREERWTVLIEEDDSNIVALATVVVELPDDQLTD